MKNALVIGYGSIGKRHASNLAGLNYNVVVKTNHPDGNARYVFTSTYADLHHFDVAVIASPTACHLNDLTACVTNGIRKILVEKPIEINLKQSLAYRKLCDVHGIDCTIAYCLRFHPLIIRLKSYIAEQLKDIRLVKISAGSFLPLWRPNSDYTRSYSAHKDQGGGVHLDLSHEIDYLLWIFGKPDEIIYRHVDHISDLTIDSYDYFKGLFRYPTFIADVELDYFRKNERSVQVIGENRELCFLDLVQGTMVIDGKPSLPDEFEHFTLNDMYIDELQDFMLSIHDRKGCTLTEALDVMKIVNLP